MKCPYSIQSFNWDACNVCSSFIQNNWWIKRRRVMFLHPIEMINFHLTWDKILKYFIPNSRYAIKDKFNARCEIHDVQNDKTIHEVETLYTSASDTCCD